MNAEISDKELVAQCQKELPYETNSFEILVDRYKQKVFAKARSILKNDDDARDLSQDIFIKIFHGLPSFRSEAAFSTWLYTITTNACLNHLDKMQRRPWWKFSESIDELKENEQEEEALFLMIGHSLERKEARRMIDRTLNDLDQTNKEALQLRYFEEKDYQSLAKQLGIKLSAAKMRVKRAREEFKKQYLKNYKGV